MSTVSATTPVELVESVYATLPERAAIGRERLRRPLTLTEKILINHLLDAEHGGHPLGRAGERELDDPSLGVPSAALELVLDRAEVLEALTHGLGRDEPPEALPCRDEALVLDELERPAHRHPAHPVLPAQLGLAGQRATGPGDDPFAQGVGKLQVAHHLYRSCYFITDTNAA